MPVTSLAKLRDNWETKQKIEFSVKYLTVFRANSGQISGKINQKFWSRGTFPGENLDDPDTGRTVYLFYQHDECVASSLELHGRPRLDEPVKPASNDITGVDIAYYAISSIFFLHKAPPSVPSLLL